MEQIDSTKWVSCQTGSAEHLQALNLTRNFTSTENTFGNFSQTKLLPRKKSPELYTRQSVETQASKSVLKASAGLHLDHHEQEYFLKDLHHHRDQQEPQKALKVIQDVRRNVVD